MRIVKVFVKAKKFDNDAESLSGGDSEVTGRLSIDGRSSENDDIEEFDEFEARNLAQEVRRIYSMLQ